MSLEDTIEEPLLSEVGRDGGGDVALLLGSKGCTESPLETSEEGRGGGANVDESVPAEAAFCNEEG